MMITAVIDEIREENPNLTTAQVFKEISYLFDRDKIDLMMYLSVEIPKVEKNENELNEAENLFVNLSGDFALVVLNSSLIPQCKTILDILKYEITSSSEEIIALHTLLVEAYTHRCNKYDLVKRSLQSGYNSELRLQIRKADEAFDERFSLWEDTILQLKSK